MTKVTKKQANEFIDMLNDFAADDRIAIPGISLEEARNTRREPMNRKIRAVLRALVAQLPVEPEA